MKLDADQLGKSPKDIIMSLTTNQWQELNEELEADSEYKSHNTTGNLGVIFEKLGIKADAKKLASEILRGNYGAASDKIYALATVQGDWFEKLLQESQSPR